jgi:site-specific DNA recombinase
VRVVGYVRVSTQEQATEGVSLAAQESKLRAYCAALELELVAVVADAGVSAKSLERPGLTQALALLDSGAAEGLLVCKLDRLTRSVRDLGALLDGYFSARFSLLSVSDSIDTRTAAGRLVLNLLTSVASWEREACAERTSAALRHKVAVGEHVGAPRLGVAVVDGALQEVAEERATVERILELRASGLSLRAVAERLAEEGHQTKRGGKWAAATVRLVLRREGVA